MRLPLVTALALTLAASGRPLSAQSATPSGPAPSPEIARAIAAVESRLVRALDQRDRAALEQIVAEPFTWVHASDGRTDSREVWLASAAQGMALTGQRSIRSEHGPTLAVYGGTDSAGPNTVVRVARVRLRDPAGARESWLRQTQVYVRGADGAWRLASGQGTLMYEGPALDSALHARYAGTYLISPGRALTLAWEDGALFATFPNGATTQIFLASPTEEAVRTLGAGQLRFTLGADGRPVAASLVRNEQEVWRATRSVP